MQWEHLTPADFEEFFAQGNTMCVVPVGSMEKHGKHLPVGNDTLTGNIICQRVAERVPCIVTPPFYITHVCPASTAPGALHLSVPDLLDYFGKICDEIGRNGFKKIVLVSAHGGNWVWLPPLVKDLGCRNKPYFAFTCGTQFMGREEDKELFDAPRDLGGHGGASETAVALELYGDLVRRDEMEKHEAVYESSLPYDVSPAQGTYDFVASYPKIYNGRPAAATKEIGKILVEHAVEDLAKVLLKIHETDITVLENMRDRLEAMTASPKDR